MPINMPLHNLCFSFKTNQFRKIHNEFYKHGLKNNTCDLAVMGGGIIGASIAREIITRNPNLKIYLLEKEDKPAAHQSSHNSGVIHAGIYYKPSSLKAKLCVEGSKLMFDYCQSKNIKYSQCGKLVVATDNCQVKVLTKLFNRGLENSVPGLKLLKNEEEIKKIQPNCTGLQALWSPVTANVDWETVTKHFLDDFVSHGGKILYSYNIKSINESEDSLYPLAIKSSKNQIMKAKYLISCPGLHSDLITSLVDAKEKEKLVSFRVNYNLLNNNTNSIKTNIYEVPDLTMPFLGVHFSPTTQGNILLGPNALPALKKEDYSGDEISLSYVKDVLSFCGFRRMAFKHLSNCASQFSQALCTEFQHRKLQKLIPTLKLADIKPGPSAVQAQLIDLDGNFVDDFRIDMFDGSGVAKRIVNCRFMPSPGATSSMAIAKLVSDNFYKQYNYGL